MLNKLMMFLFVVVFSCWVHAEEYIALDIEYSEKLSVYNYQKFDFDKALPLEMYGKILYSNGIHPVDQFVLESNVDSSDLNYQFALKGSNSLKFKPLYRLENLSSQPIETNQMLFKSVAVSNKNQDSFMFQNGASCIINDGFWFSEPVFLIDLTRPVIKQSSLSMYEKKQKDEYGDNFVKSGTGIWKGSSWMTIELIGYEGKHYTISAVEDGTELRHADYYNAGNNYMSMQDCIAYNTKAIEDIKQNIDKLNIKRGFLANLFNN